MNTRIRISLVICLCLFCALGTWGQNARLATLKGLVVDLNDARVPNALVVLTNGVQTYKVRTDEIGEYKITSEPGKYGISVDALPLGFDVTRRAEIWLEAAVVRTLKLKLYANDAVLGPYLSQEEGEVTEHSAVHGSYGYQELSGLSTVGVTKGMIRYATKCESGQVITFSAPGDQEGVTFTYDFSTVTADTIRMLKNENEIYALGNLTIETEDKTAKFKGKIIVRIEKGKVVYKKLD